jgi:hypothetical protein
MTQAKYISAHWITSVVFHDDGPATYAVHKKDTAPDLVADGIKDLKTATLIAASPKLLAALIDRNGELPPVKDGNCRVCGREYFGDDIPDDGMCPSDDCPHTIARAAIAEAQPPDRMA